MNRSHALDLALRRNRGRAAAPAIRKELAARLECSSESVTFASLEESDRLLGEIRRNVLALAFEGTVPETVGLFWTMVSRAVDQFAPGLEEVRTLVPVDAPLCVYYADSEFTGAPIVEAGLVLEDPFEWVDPDIGVLEAITRDRRSGFRLRVTEDERDRLAPMAEIEWCWWLSGARPAAPRR
jgi:hypothetical protein